MSTPLSEDARRHAPATLRNREPLLAVLRRVLREGASPPGAGASAPLALEVASGTGEHAVWFARQLPGWRWQPSDADPGALTSIEAWRLAVGEGPRPLPPVSLDARVHPWEIDRADAVVCINMIHIAPWEAALGLLRGASAALDPGAPLVLYGPYRRGGRHTAPSNEAFDASLRARDPSWGVRDLDEVAACALDVGLHLDEVVEMPANNLTVVFRREPPTPARSHLPAGPGPT